MDRLADAARRLHSAAVTNRALPVEDVLGLAPGVRATSVEEVSVLLRNEIAESKQVLLLLMLLAGIVDELAQDRPDVRVKVSEGLAWLEEQWDTSPG